jgi:hypothetical protein
MLAVIPARETAANSVLPILPTLKTLATFKEYCSRNVIVKGAENLAKIFSSFLVVVLASGIVPWLIT